MAIWLIRAGSHGEFEQKFIQENRVYVTWDDLNVNLANLKQRADLTTAMMERYPDTKPKAIQNWVSQVWPFAHEIKKGDLVVLPLKTQPAIYIGEVTGGYHAEPEGPNPFFHWRPVKWIAEAIPRANFGKDLLFSFGAFMTICRIQRNNAEQRIAAMRANGWKPETIAAATKATAPVTDEAAEDTTSKNWRATRLLNLSPRASRAMVSRAWWKPFSRPRATQPIEAPKGRMVARTFWPGQGRWDSVRRVCVWK